MDSCRFRTRAGIATILALSFVLLAGCDRKHEAPAQPETRRMGNSPVAVAGSCGLRSDEALQRINAARAAGQRCGARPFPPAPPLHWDDQLYSAAFGHSQDMAQHDYFEHRSPGGSSVSDRVTASHYKWRGVGENIAAGNRSLPDAVQAWLDSGPHCENLMNPEYADVAVACVAQPGTAWGTYWTMVLARR
jgi:uncharacterized protein YkwD